MYNLFTVLNSAYMPFGKIWINSLYKNVNLEQINKIFILDTGLKQDELGFLKTFDKVEIVVSDLAEERTSNASTRESIWLQHVLRKTKYFRKVLKNSSEDTPLIMVDSDCCFLGDFFHLLDKETDVLVCNRSYKEEDNWIASFFVANNSNNGKLFMDAWIRRMRQLMKEKPERGWFESHSLNLIINELKHQNSDIKISDVYTKNIACEELTMFDKNTKIIHLKGTSNKTNFQERINRFKQFVDINEYLKE